MSRDGSVIYGNNEEGMRRVRTFQDGKMKIAGDGLLEHDEKGIPISGDVRNCWAGFSLLQALFVKEHNAVCDMLKVSSNSHSIVYNIIVVMHLKQTRDCCVKYHFFFFQRFIALQKHPCL